VCKVNSAASVKRKTPHAVWERSLYAEMAGTDIGILPRHVNEYGPLCVIIDIRSVRIDACEEQKHAPEG
jgi:hypothetical protein